MDIIEQPKIFIEQVISKINEESKCIEKLDKDEKYEYIIKQLHQKIKLDYQQIYDINQANSYEELRKYNNKLVQFTGQIQDIFENLMKMQAFVTLDNKVQLTEFGEVDQQNLENINQDHNSQIFQDQRAAFIVPIQGLNNWIYQKTKNNEFQLYNHKQEKFLPAVAFLDLVEEQPLIINKQVRVIGILQIENDNQINEEQQDNIEQAFDANFEDNYPKDKVPRILCVIYEQLSNDDLIDQVFQKKQFSNLFNHNQPISFVQFINQLFKNQPFPFIIIISIIQSQYICQQGQYLGKTIFNINQSHKFQFTYKSFKFTFDQVFIQICKRFLFKTKTITIDNSNLSKVSIDGIKNYDTNILQYGESQLTEETFLILDETKLKEGNLSQQTTKNLQSLQKLLQLNQTNLDFQFQQLSNDLILSTVITSCSKSLLDWDLEIRVEEGEQELSDEEFKMLFLEDDDLAEELQKKCDRFRVEVVEMQRMIKKVEIEKSIGEEITQNFVKQIQNVNKAENLQRQLHLAKCLAASSLTHQMTYQHFTQIQQYDDQFRKTKK